jgi:glycosyltransferase involved in cell wall biosynthesis
LFGIDEDRVIVAHPDTTSVLKNENAAHDFGSDFVFFYPSFPRVFKNHEVICKAVDILNRQKRRDFKVIFTMAGDENRYSRHVHKNYGYLENIVFMPPVKREVIADLYCAADCVIFASKLETWGIPISEAKHFEKPLLLADLEYAHETLGDYDKVRFFRHDDHVGLAGLMKSAMDNEISYEKTASSVISKPFSRNWEELFTILLS